MHKSAINYFKQWKIDPIVKSGFAIRSPQKTIDLSMPLD